MNSADLASLKVNSKDKLTADSKKILIQVKVVIITRIDTSNFLCAPPPAEAARVR